MDVLGGLFFENVQNVVDRHDSHQETLGVHHRKDREVVVGHQPSHILLVRVRMGLHHICVHDVSDKRLRVGDDQIPEGKDTREVVRSVHHV